MRARGNFAAIARARIGTFAVPPVQQTTSTSLAEIFADAIPPTGEGEVSAEAAAEVVPVPMPEPVPPPVAKPAKGAKAAAAAAVVKEPKAAARPKSKAG